MFLPLYSLVMNWVFPLKLSYRIESLRIWEHLMYVLHVLICGDNEISRDLLDVCFVINLRVLLPCELMHRGWHTFSSWLSGRNFGALFEVLCVGWIDESEIVWCISYNHTHRYLRWPWSIKVTLGFWLICVLRCYSSTDSRAVCDTYRNSPTDWLERITLRWFRTLQ